MMEKSKYQIAKRFLPLGFVLFIVLLCACNGGYEPEGGGEDSIIPDYIDGKLVTVKVIIPRKITDDILNGKNQGYEVRWEATGGIVGTVSADSIKEGETLPCTSPHFMYSTTVFFFYDLNTVTNITINVYIGLYDDTTGEFEPRGLVASKEIPTTNTPTP